VNTTPFTPLKLLRHGDRVEAMLRGETVFPISVELDLSNKCPHDCPFCSFGTSASQGYRQQYWVTFPTPRIYTLLEELKEVGVKSVTFTGGGEPLVHRAAASIFEKATQVGLQWGVVTNGYLLRGDVASWIAKHATFVRVSLDAGSAETHAFTHGLPPGQFQFSIILDQMRHCRELAGPRLTIGAGYCVMEETWREIYRAAQLVKEHGGNYLEVRPTFPTEWRGDGWGQALQPESVEAAKHEIAHAKTHLNDDTFQVIGMVERFDLLAHPHKTYDQCRIGPLMTVIGADARGWHCCVMRGQEGFSWGDVKAQSFKQAWLAAQRHQAAAEIDLTKCPRCRYDGFNRIIQDAFIEGRMHQDFL